MAFEAYPSLGAMVIMGSMEFRGLGFLRFRV